MPVIPVRLPMGLVESWPFNLSPLIVPVCKVLLPRSGIISHFSSEHVRDLDVTLSSDTTFTEHISRTTVSASLKCSWILRTFRTREKLPLITLWKALVAPVLDYCSQLWSPSTPGLIQKLESIQSNFFNKIVGMRSFDYWQQLEALKMSSLQRRRERYTCIYVWKVLEGLVPNFGLNSTHSIRRGRSCIVPSVKRTGSQRYQTIRFNSATVLGPRLFNHLPAGIRDMTGCSVDTFKRALDNHLDTVPDEPRLPRLVRYCSKGSNSILEYNSKSIAAPSRLADHTDGQLTAAPSRLADQTGSQPTTATPNRLADHMDVQPPAEPGRLADHTDGQPSAAPSSLADHNGGQPTATPNRLADHIGGRPPAAPSHLAERTGGQPTVAPSRLADQTGDHPTAAPHRLAEHTGDQPIAAPSRLADHTGGEPTAAPSRLAEHTGGQLTAAQSRLADQTGGQPTAALGCHIT